MASGCTQHYEYNSLFSGGMRKWVHSARFRWLQDSFGRHRYTPRRVLELGCYDAKTIDYLPKMPQLYQGFDANWDGGLELGESRWHRLPNVRLSLCTTPEQMTGEDAGFDTAICMETLEHVPPPLMEPYLDRLQRLTRGMVWITVPNEMGLVFLAKYLAKAAVYGSSYHYRAREVVAATLRRAERIERKEHKGFDYRNVVRAVAERFDLVEVVGLPLRWLPPRWGVTVGIVARTVGLSDGYTPSSVTELDPPPAVAPAP